ncbi:MAG: helix-turn-helix transcriptional regulator [Panacagrimonas sp.]
MLPDTFLRLPAVKAATGLSRSTIYDRISKGTFPAPVSMGGKAVAWPASEIGAWIQNRTAGRRFVEVTDKNAVQRQSA